MAKTSKRAISINNTAFQNIENTLPSLYNKDAQRVKE
jgi:hypothetical protein